MTAIRRIPGFKTLRPLAVRTALALLAAAAIVSPAAAANQYRYAHLTWEPGVATNAVEFTLIEGFKRTAFPGPPNVGDIINDPDGVQLRFGDATAFSPALRFKVIAIDPANDWLMARALQPGSSTKTTVSHTYPSSTDPDGFPWVAEIQDCCRATAQLQPPNRGGTYRVLTYVETASGNRSPVSSMPPVVNVKQGGIQRFRVPAIDRDPDTHLQFRVGRGAEAGYPLFFFIPGLTIDPDTGEVTWDTSGLTPGFYAEQFVIEDYSASTGEFRTSVAVDLNLHLFDCTQAPPSFDPPTPAAGTSFVAVNDQPLCFTVQASNPSGGDVTLDVAGIPEGATLSTPLPATGNPVSTTFCWTPHGRGTATALTFTADNGC
jgi:hypothetical protein